LGDSTDKIISVGWRNLDIDELKGRLGTELWAVEFEIEKGMVRRFVQAVDDPNPRWQVMAPPTLVLTVGIDQIQQWQASVFPSATLLHGSTELECYQPVKVGDVIKASVAVAGVRERPGKMGKTLFITLETSYTDQRQEPVARSRQLVMSY
jgi:hydroxyacyl-ACP dehydratase HTD2-like protein with hotdog domain